MRCTLAQVRSCLPGVSFTPAEVPCTGLGVEVSSRRCPIRSRECSFRLRDCPVRFRKCSTCLGKCPARPRKCATRSGKCAVRSRRCPAQVWEWKFPSPEVPVHPRKSRLTPQARCGKANHRPLSLVFDQAPRSSGSKAHQFLIHFAHSSSFVLSSVGSDSGLLPPVDHKSKLARLNPNSKESRSSRAAAVE